MEFLVPRRPDHRLFGLTYIQHTAESLQNVLIAARIPFGEGDDKSLLYFKANEFAPSLNEDEIDNLSHLLNSISDTAQRLKDLQDTLSGRLYTFAENANVIRQRKSQFPPD